MKLKIIVYIFIMTFLSVYSGPQFIYGFETPKKIIFHSAVEIGPEGQSYQLPGIKGPPNSILQLGNDNRLRWVPLSYPDPELTDLGVSEPFFKTRDKCPVDTKFLPLYPGDLVENGGGKALTRGYCLVTDNGEWGPNDTGTGVLSDWVPLTEAGFYCVEKYQAHTFKKDLIWPRLYAALDIGFIAAEKFHNYFNAEDSAEIEAFFQALRDKFIITRSINSYYAGYYGLLHPLATVEQLPDSRGMRVVPGVLILISRTGKQEDFKNPFPKEKYYDEDNSFEFAYSNETIIHYLPVFGEKITFELKEARVVMPDPDYPYHSGSPHYGISGPLYPPEKINPNMQPDQSRVPIYSMNKWSHGHVLCLR